MKITIYLSLLLLPFFSFSQDNPIAHYKIYNTHSKNLVSIDNIINSMTGADVLFFGEEHNDSTGHQLELILLKNLSEKYPRKIALSMEMFETDRQTVLNEYLTGLISENSFTNDAKAWPNYGDYRPLIELAKSATIPVIAANAPSRYTSMVNHMGLASLQQLDTTAKGWLPPLPIDTATGPYYDKFVQIMGGHASMPGMQMYQAQNLWDATMGWSIARFMKDHPGYKILQINGGFHSEQKLGTAAQLIKYNPKSRIINIAVYADDSFDTPDWTKFSKMGDYIILTDPKLPKTF